VGTEAQVRRQDALRFLSSARGAFDLVFIDPPYDSAVRVAGPLSERLPVVLTRQARIVTESDKRAPLELSLPLEMERIYGDTRIAIHRA
jgi:16S rRNA (guanine966-N2)-methyltransferase